MKNKIYRQASGLSMILFPIMLLAGFLMHPDILSLSMVHSVEGLVANFHHQPLFHIGHLIVFAAVPFIILALTGLMLYPVINGKNWLVAGGFIGLVGAVILGGDKGALCLVLSAFESLSETDFQQITPALVTILQRRGLLVMFYLLPLLPLGASAQIIGLIKNRSMGVLPGVLTIAGLLLLNNPDIELISSVGAFFMCIGYIPLGIKIFREDWI